MRNKILSIVILVCMLCAIFAALSQHARADAPLSAGIQSETPPPSQLPVVTLLSPAEGEVVTSTPVIIRARVRWPNGETIIGVHARVTGERGILRVKLEGREKGQESITFTQAVPIPQRDCTVEVVAETEHHKSEPTLVHLRWKEGLDPGLDRALLPSLHVLAIGVSEYQKTDMRLRFAAKDARDLAGVFKEQPKSFYRTVTVEVLTDHEATRDHILDALDTLRKHTTAQDVAVLFLAGHGITDPGTGSYYFLPYDADPEAITRTMIPEGQILLTLKSIAGKRLLFLDTCHSGKVFSEDTRGVEDITSFVKELANAENGTVVFTASTGRQASLEAPAWQNGAFTRAVVEGLQGKASLGRSGKITVSMLEHYVAERVKELTGGKQTPTTAKPSTVSDFPLVVKVRADAGEFAPIH